MSSSTARSTASSTRPGPADKEILDGLEIRRAAVERGIPCITSVDTAKTVVDAMEKRERGLHRRADPDVPPGEFRVLMWIRRGRPACSDPMPAQAAALRGQHEVDRLRNVTGTSMTDISTGNPIAGRGWAREFRGAITATEPVMGDSMLVTFAAPPNLVREARAGQFVEILCRSPLVDRSPPASPLLRLRRRPGAWRADRARRGPMGAAAPGWSSKPVGTDARCARTAWQHLHRRPEEPEPAAGGGRGRRRAAPHAGRTRRSGRVSTSPTCWVRCTPTACSTPDHLPGEVEYVVATDDGSAGHHGFVTDLIPEYLPWADQVFTCGPEPMFRSLRRAGAARTASAAKPSVQVSVERTMACGVGACLGCVVETKRGMKTSCVEGPVFDMDDLVWS